MARLLNKQHAQRIVLVNPQRRGKFGCPVFSAGENPVKFGAV
jgi:hypothetical protein